MCCGVWWYHFCNDETNDRYGKEYLMDTYVTGSAIRRLREEKHLTQNELARLEQLSVR